MLFWNANDLKAPNIFSTINTLSQLFHITTRLRPIILNSTPSSLTNIVPKPFTSIGVLDLLHNTSAAYF